MSIPIAQVIKYEDENQALIWKHPIEDFYTGSQLIVHESQEAIFFMNGQALDTFSAGRYTLETENIPIVSGLFKRATGEITPFHCELYFVKKTEQMAIKWGTDTKMEYVEPNYGFPIQIGACGEMNIRIEDGRKLLIKVIGTEQGITQLSLMQKCRAFLMMKIKPYIVRLMKERKINIFQIDEHLQVISEELHNLLKKDFLNYGISLERFLVVNIIKPEEDKNYRRFKEIHFRQYADVAEAKLRQQIDVIDQQTVTQKMIIEAQGIAQKRQIEGYSYQDEKRFNVAEKIASNQSVGQFANVGLGMGIISGVGSNITNAVSGMMSNIIEKKDTHNPLPVLPAEGEKCNSCGAIISKEAKFCLECGAELHLSNSNSEIICPSCGNKVKRHKFCSECGKALYLKCTKCGKETQIGTKYCPECGNKF